MGNFSDFIVTKRVETDDIIDLNVTTGKLADSAVTPSKLAEAYVKKSGDTMTGTLNLKSGGGTVLDAKVGNLVNVSLIRLGTISLIFASNGGTDRVGINGNNVISPVQAATASAPAYIKGGLYFDLTLNALMRGGATAWEQIADAAVTAAKIATDAVITAKILAKNVTTAKVADAAITQAQQKIKTVVALADAAATLTAAQMVDSGIFTITPTVARTLTTDTAANIVAALPDYQVGTWFDIVIVNTAAFDVTLAAGTGITLSGKAIINNVSGTWRARIDSATAVTIYRM